MEYYYSVKKNSIVEFAGLKIGSSHEVSYRKKGPAENRTTGHLYYLQAKAMTALCSYSESLNEAEFKSNGLTFWQRKAQVRALSVLYLSYCLLLAPRLTAIQHKKQDKNTWKMSSLVGKKNIKLQRQGRCFESRGSC